MLRQAEMSFFGEVRAEVKCVQGVTVGVVFARNIVAFVSVFFAVTEKRLMYAWMYWRLEKFGFSGLTG